MSVRSPLVSLLRRTFAWSVVLAAGALLSAQEPAHPQAVPVAPAAAGARLRLLVAGGADAAWVTPVREYLDPARTELLDRTFPGRSLRTLMAGDDWDRVVAELKTGDVVLIPFGREDTVEDTAHGRRMAADVKGKGARPILLTPAGRDPGRMADALREAAKVEGVPLVDLAKLTAGLPEAATPANAAALRLTAARVVSGLKGLRDQALVRALSAAGRALPMATPDQVFVVVQPPPRNAPEDFQRWLNLPEPGDPALPNLFLIGDSTVRNGRGDGYDGQFGWGDPFAAYFDPAKINVVNRAVGGTGVRTFIASGYWDRVLALLKPGDIVIMQFGHNNDSLAGLGEEAEERLNARTGETNLQHTFGWYLRKYIADTRAKGAIPVVCSLVPRKTWRDGRIARSKETFAGWADQVATSERAPFLDLNELIARRYDALGTAAVDQLFADANTHTNWAGAVLNAEAVIAALQSLPANQVRPFLAAGTSP
jgi:lysophospholipase L1-like esterase